MKLARYTVNGRTAIGVVHHHRVVALGELVPDAPATISEVLSAGAGLLDRLAKAIQAGPAGHSLSEVHLEAPVPEARKYLAIGMNYEDHAEEARRAGLQVPKTQLWFNKQVTCIHGPFDPVVIPRVSDKVDYEAELGVVIGKRCRYVSIEDARSVVGGYFVANDVTARDWQQASPTFTLGKSFDTHGPIGPWVVTDDEIADPHA
ncbi:MAG: fumarylacetoacetate hydrolase family protein, partial [Phenylobacterium sp.]|uniref:fumarylacetoacetate hydrolase family protein n=1 Tax=Phenylobacterium sp. TaxID=1871053 RepID=UPI0027373ACA